MSTILSYRRSKLKSFSILLTGLMILIVSFVSDLATGPGNYSISDLFAGLLESDSASQKMRFVLWDLRMPVALLAILVGAMLGLAGALIQTILNNPLAEPFTLGISSAASFGAALAIIMGAQSFGLAGLWDPAWGGALVTALSAFTFSLVAAVILLLFTKLRGISSQNLVLVGIALLFTFNALLSLVQFTASDAQLSQIIFWMMGSLGRANWYSVVICVSVFSVLFPWFVYRSWSLTALRLGDLKAYALGVDTARVRVEVLLGASLLAATTVSFVGVVGFVGLVGPHIARMLIGEDQRFFLPASAVFGAVLMSLTSLISKALSPGLVYPVGIITALIGVPFFLLLILSSRQRVYR